MPLDQAANLVAESLTSAVGSSTTTFAVSDASAYPDPANGEYNAVVWNANDYETPSDDPDAEIVRVTGRDTGEDTLTVTRGQEGTSAASHPTGARVPVALTAKMIDDIEAELDAVGGEVSVSDNGTVVVSAAEDLNLASNLTVTDDGDNTATIDATDTDTRIDVSDDGTLVLSEPTDVNFGANLSVVDDTDGTVTVDATDTDTRTDVSQDGTTVVTETTDINFTASDDASINVTDDGDGTVSVDVSATDTTIEDTRTDVSDSGTQVVTDVEDINFDSNLTVTDDGDDTVTVDGESGASVTSLDPTQATDGEEPSATGDDALALGVSFNTVATDNSAVAIGNDTEASGNLATALGASAVASNNGAAALGAEAVASGDQAIHVGGPGLGATAENAIAVGNQVTADAVQSIALGNGADTEGETKLAVAFGGSQGNKMELDEDGNLSVEGEFVGGAGDVTSLDPTQATDGEEPSATGDNALALGAAFNPIASGEQAVAIGNDTEASGLGATALGAIAEASNSTAVALGAEAVASGDSAIHVGGAGLGATAENAIAVGSQVTADAVQSIALGDNADTQGQTRLTINVGESETLRQDADGRLQAGPDETNLEDVSTMTVTRRYS